MSGTQCATLADKWHACPAPNKKLGVHNSADRSIPEWEEQQEEGLRSNRGMYRYSVTNVVDHRPKQETRM